MLDAGIPDIAIEKDKAVQKIEQRYYMLLAFFFTRIIVF